MSKPFRVGDEVYCLRRGHGRVTKIGAGDFPVWCVFVGRRQVSYKADGREILDDINPILYHANSGVIEFDTTKPLPKVEKDQAVWVRDNEYREWETRHFYKWGENGLMHCFPAGQTSHSSVDKGSSWTWKYYSLTDPNTPDS